MKRENILAHRGIWSREEDQNSLQALVDAVKSGFGVETDFRDFSGNLVISHDLPSSEMYLTADAFFSEYNHCKSEGRLALNIKADGLQRLLIETLERNKIDRKKYFAFDMSVPDALHFFKINFPVYTRTSEYEEIPSFLSRAVGVWVDSFTEKFPQVEVAQKLIDDGYRVTLVSPELHGRSYINIWDEVYSVGLHKNCNFELCTDYPKLAYEKFGEKNDKSNTI